MTLDISLQIERKQNNRKTQRFHFYEIMKLFQYLVPHGDFMFYFLIYILTFIIMDNE